MNHFAYRDGVLHAEDVPLPAIAAAVGTPFYCYSTATLVRHYRVFREAFAGLDTLICYAVKANSNLSVLRLLAEEGAGFDIVSGGELYRVLRAGGSPSKVVFSGVGKTREEVEYALSSGIHSFNCESEAELALIDSIASRLGTTARIAMRVNPHVDAQTHPYISTGLRDHKFGIDIAAVEDVYQRAAAFPNLVAEGVPPNRIVFVGNVMIDTLMQQLPVAHATNTLERLGLRRRHYVAATLHRPSNVDDPAALAAVLEGLALVADSIPVVLPLHPRTLKNIERFHLGPMLTPLTVLEPLGYTEMLALTDGAQCVLTDSGGIQEETTALGVPCVTLREQTERPVTISEGTNRMAAWPLTPRGILDSYLESVSTVAGMTPRRPAGWDGHAAERIVTALERHILAAVGAGPRSRPWSPDGA